MTEILMPRRRFLMGVVGLLAAPAVVRAESLMPVKAMPADAETAAMFDETARRSVKRLSDFVQPHVFARYDEFGSFWRVMSTG
jgi:hypothetical protein